MPKKYTSIHTYIYTYLSNQISLSGVAKASLASVSARGRWTNTARLMPCGRNSMVKHLYTV